MEKSNVKIEPTQLQHILMQVLVEDAYISHDSEKSLLRYIVTDVMERLEEEFKGENCYDINGFSEVYSNDFYGGERDYTHLFVRHLARNPPLTEQEITDFLEELKGKEDFEGLKYKFVIFDAMPFREERMPHPGGDIDGHDGGHPQDRD